MFLLPYAERYRRVVTLVTICSILAVLAFVRPAILDRAVGAVLAPVSGLLAPAAGWAAEVFLGPPAEAAEVAAPAEILANLERRAGAPPPGNGVAWFEVPVLEHRFGSGTILIAAGEDHRIVEGLPVVFGKQWLGRISEVTERTAEVRLWTAAEEPTGVNLGPLEARRGRGVCVGRGEGRAPVMKHLEEGGEPSADMQLTWRPQRDDPVPGLDGVIEVGKLFSEGDPKRGEETWQIGWTLPDGAEGRVFVAMAARTEQLVAEPPITSARAAWVLRSDGVFGSRLSAARVDGDPAGVLVQDGRVFGPIVNSLGSLAWGRRMSPSAWRNAAEAVESGSDLFTRGNRVVPRGMWLGTDGSEAPAAGAGDLQAVRRSEP